MSQSLTVARAHGSFCRLQKISDCDEHSARCPCACGLPQGEDIPLYDPDGLFVFNLGSECGPGWALFFLFSSRSAVMLLCAFVLHLPLIMAYGVTPDLRNMWRAGNEEVEVAIDGNSVHCAMSPTSTNQFLGHSDVYGNITVAYSQRLSLWSIAGDSLLAIAVQNSTDDARDSTLDNVMWIDLEGDAIISAKHRLTRVYISYYWLTAGNLGPESFHGIWLTFPSHLTVILIAIYVAVFLASRKTLKTRLVHARHSPSHYTVHVTKLPEGTNEDEVKDFFNAVLDDGSEDPPEKCVVKVLLLYRLGAFAASFKRRSKLELKHSVLQKAFEKYSRIQEFEQMHGIKAGWLRSFYRSAKMQNYHRVATAFQEVDIEIQSWMQNSMHTAVCGAFVTFKLPMHAQQVLNAVSGWETRQRSLQSTALVQRIKTTKKQHHLRIRKAPEPSDVNWENVGVKGRYIVFRSMMTYTVFIVLCFATFEIIKQLHIWRENGMDKGNYQETSLGRFTSVLQIILITMMASLVCFAGRCERMKRKSHDETSVMIKVSILLVLNVGVSILLVETMLWNNVGVFGGFRGIVQRLGNAQMPGVPWYLSYSVAHQILTYLGSSCLVTPLFILLDPHYTLVRRTSRLLAFSVKKYRISRTQKELNKLWEPSNFFLYYRIAFVLHIAVVSFWYMAIAPLALLFGAGVLVICYWVDKYVLLVHRRRPNYQDMHVVLKAISLFQGALVVQPFFTAVLLTPTSASSVSGTLAGLLLASGVSLVVLCISTWSEEIGNYLLPYLKQPNECFNSAEPDANAPFLAHRRRFPALIKALRALYEQMLPQMSRYGVSEQRMQRQECFIDRGVPFHVAQYSFADQYHKLNPVCAFLPESVNPRFLPIESARNATVTKVSAQADFGICSQNLPDASIEMSNLDMRAGWHSDSNSTSSDDSRATAEGSKRRLWAS